MRAMRIAFLIVTIAALSTNLVSAQTQTVTAYKTGERTTGTTKQCDYQWAGKRYTRTVSSVQLCPFSIQVTVVAPTPPPKPKPMYGTAYKTGERTTGTTKQCYYSYAGRSYTHTVQSYELCPMSIRDWGQVTS